MASDPAAKTVNRSPARPAATPFVAADANGGSSIDLSLLLLPLFAGVVCLAGFWAVRKSLP